MAVVALTKRGYCEDAKKCDEERTRREVLVRLRYISICFIHVDLRRSLRCISSAQVHKFLVPV